MPASASASNGDFVAEEFQTSYSEADISSVIDVLSGSIERLREQIGDDDLDEILRGKPGPDRLTSRDTRDKLQPEGRV
jgi:hypothetical protein